LALADSPLISVAAMGLAVLGTHEDVAQARLEFASGCIANLSASRVSFAPSPRRQMQIWTAHGFAAIDFGNRTSHVVHPSAAVAERRFDYNTLTPEEKAGFQERVFTEILCVEPLVVETRNALSDELREFIGSIRGTATPRVTIEAGREAVWVAEEILNSIRDHAWHGQHQGPIGPLALPQRSILRGPHWQPSPHPRPIREAG
jgi:predicted dehydrogenase